MTRPYREAARYYHARPPYSADLRPVLAAKLGWNASGRLLDVGCGPGVVALELAPSFAQVVGLDPEERMLEEARALTPRPDDGKIEWIHGRAEDIPTLNLGRFQAIALAQSFHWTDKLLVANIAYDSLDDGGSMLLIHHEAPVRATSKSSHRAGHPLIPYEAIDDVLVRWLGRGKPPPDPNREPYQDLLARTRFGSSERLFLPGRIDLVRSVDDVIDNYLSTSFAAPELFGDRLGDFRGDLAMTLRARTDTGFFWEWPRDTEVLIATKGWPG